MNLKGKKLKLIPVHSNVHLNPTSKLRLLIKTYSRYILI